MNNEGKGHQTFKLIRKRSWKCINTTWTNALILMEKKQVYYSNPNLFYHSSETQVQILQHYICQHKAQNNKKQNLNQYPNKTRTTRTPAFWGYPPPPHDYPHYLVMLDPPSQNKVEWPWRYRSRSKVMTCNTPHHASDHLYQIWK